MNSALLGMTAEEYGAFVKRGVEAARGACAKSCNYNGVFVGAAVVTERDEWITAGNIGFPGGDNNCAERNAVIIALNEGKIGKQGRIKAVFVAVSGEEHEPKAPCASCRGVIAAHAIPGARVICVNGDASQIEDLSIEEWYPHPYASSRQLLYGEDCK